MSHIPHILYYDGARVSPESKIGQELMKWERKPDWTPEKNPFPKMLYRAQNRPDGRRSVGEVNDALCGGYPNAAQQFTARCQMTVHNEHEMIRALQQGWCKTQEEALAGLEARENVISTAAAERHYSDQRMSEAAQAEAAEADASTARHVPEVTPEVLGQAREKRKYTRRKSVS